MLKADIVDELHVMRKVVIDGSNTTGFQRSVLIGLNGEIEVEGKKIPIQTICLEEDSARKVRDEGVLTAYRLDRLGIPLIEIATAPVISSPEEAKRVALRIGQILRATGRVKRGIGTIRQDLNISISGGPIIEVKGVQELDLLPKVIENEVKRQLSLLRVKEELQKRDVRDDDLREEFINVTHLFRDTKSKLIQSSLKKGAEVYALKLPKFAGLLGLELMPNYRFGTELAYRAIFFGGVKGILHTDELPNYGITDEEVKKLKKELNCSDNDAVVLVVDKAEKAKEALKAVLERVKEALRGIPSETRGVKPDGTTFYERPRPGAARMYPETDIKPVEVTLERLEKLRSQLPELPEEKINRLMRKYGINKKLASQLLESDYTDLFEKICAEVSVSPSYIATVLSEVLKSLKRSGVPIENLTDAHILEVFRAVEQGKTAKESIPEILAWLAKSPQFSVDKAVEELGLGLLSEEELDGIISKTIQDNIQLIREKGKNAHKILVGYVMKKVRGRADGRKIAKIIAEKIEKISGG